VRFGNPLTLSGTLDINTPGVSLGSLQLPGGNWGSFSATFTLPTGTRALAFYPQIGALPPGSQIFFTGATTFTAYGGDTPGGGGIPVSGTSGGSVCVRVEPSLDPQVTVYIGFPLTVFGGTTTLGYLVALTDSAAVGIFGVAGMLPTNAVPIGSSTVQNSGVGSAGGTTYVALAASGNHQYRIWDCQVNLTDTVANQQAYVSVFGSVSLQPLGLLRVVGIGADNGFTVGGGLILPAGDGVSFTVLGANATGGVTVEYDIAT
jgi:hypothetical protein